MSRLVPSVPVARQADLHNAYEESRCGTQRFPQLKITASPGFTAL